MDYSVSEAEKLGCGAICIEGNEAFYGQSGFVLAGEEKIFYYTASDREILPYFLLKEIKVGYLQGVSGIYKPPHGYFIDETKAEEFDTRFPVKENEILPGQLV